MAAKGRIATAHLTEGSIVITSPDGYPTQRKTGTAREVVKVEAKAPTGRGHSKSGPKRYDITFHDGVVAENLAGVQTWTKGNMVVGGSATKAAEAKNEASVTDLAAKRTAKAAKAPAKAAKAPAKAAKAAKAVKAPKVEQVALTTGAKRLEDGAAHVQAIADPLERMAAMTELIAEARALISTLSEGRVELAKAAHAKGISYTDLAKAAGMSPARMAQIGAGRRAYIPVSQR